METMATSSMLFVMVVMCFTCAVSDSQERCIDSEQQQKVITPSLAQKKTGVHKAFSMAVEKNSLNLASVIRQVEQLEANPGTAKEDLDKVKELISVLTNKFEEELKTQSGDDQTSYNTRKNSHETCSNHLRKRLNETTGDIPQAKRQAEIKKDKHQKCRKFQKTLETLTNIAKKVGEGTWQTLAKEEMAEQDQLCGESNDFDAEKTDYSDAEPKGQVSGSCNEDQSSFENSHCYWITLKKTACIAEDECLAAVDLDSYKQEIEVRIASRKAIFKTIQILKCRLDHIYNLFNSTTAVSDSNTTDDCAKTDPDVTLFDLDLGIPTAVKCSDDADITTGLLYPHEQDTAKCDAWRNANYAFDAHHSQVQDCEVTCIIPSTVGVNPTLPQPGCLDLDTVCPFYNRHWSACGKYGDDAQTKCCACGGGQTPTPAPTPAPTQQATAFTNLRTRGFGDNPAVITLPSAVTASSIKFTRIAGHVRGNSLVRYFGVCPNFAELAITAMDNRVVIVPTASNTIGFTKLNQDWGYFYKLQDQDCNSGTLTWNFISPITFSAGSYRLWLGEDIMDSSESDNSNMDLTVNVDFL